MFKPISVLLNFFLLFSACSGLFNEYHSVLDSTASFVQQISGRSKRSSYCPTRCSAEMENNLRRNLHLLYENQGIFNPQLFSTVLKSQSEIYCTNIMKPFINCIDACPYSNLRDMLQHATKAVKVLCVDRYQEIRDNYKCLKNPDSDELEDCQTLECPDIVDANKQMQNYKEEMQQYRFNSYGVKPDMNRYSQLLGDYCEAFGCPRLCNRNRIANQCGKNIANILDEIYYETMISLKYFIDQANGAIVFPDQCVKIIQDTRQTMAIQDTRQTVAFQDTRQTVAFDFNYDEDKYATKSSIVDKDPKIKPADMSSIPIGNSHDLKQGSDKQKDHIAQTKSADSSKGKILLVVLLLCVLKRIEMQLH